MRFSLIIPVAPNRTPEIFQSLDKLDYPLSKFEVIVEKGTNPSENRNRGIKRAKGGILVFLDDDAQIDKNFLKEIDVFSKKYPEIDIVGGPQLTLEDHRFFSKLSEIIFTSSFGAFGVNKRYRKCSLNLNADETYLTSANLYVKKGVFKKIDGFDIKLYPGEDPEFIFRAKKNGLKVAYNPEMIIYHKRRDNFPKFCEQIFRYGFTRPRKNKMSGKTQLFFFIPLIFSVYFMFMPILVLINIVFIIPFLCYVGLSLLFSVYDSIRKKIFSGLLLLPFLYLFTHLNYGIGMVGGYVERILEL